MIAPLETANTSRPLRRIVIDPVTRVEGHGKVTILLDEDSRVHQVRLHIVEFRGFEKFIQGRPFWEVPVLVQRLCGICPVSHHLAAGKAIDMLVGSRRITPSAEKLRRLLHSGQMLQSHALHFFHLASPDLLFGFEAEPERRNVVAVINEHRDLALRGVTLRKFGQEIIRAIAGKRVHGVACVPGGMNKPLAAADREALRRETPQVIRWCQEAVRACRDLLDASPHAPIFGLFPSNFLSLTRDDGALEFYDGGLRARDAQGGLIFDHVDTTHYNRYIHEEVKSWSYMKFPFIINLGEDDGWYRVGPLARVNNCDRIDTVFAEHERQLFRQAANGGLHHATLMYHWARLIEMLHAAEDIERLLDDPETMGTDLIVKGERQLEGVGVIEAPRGTLFHHYKVDENDVVVRANLIVSTTNNNQAMNEAVRNVAASYLDGQRLTEGLLNHIEVAVRAFDPCLSCATHALGRMPLQVELVDAAGTVIDRLAKHGDGSFEG